MTIRVHHAGRLLSLGPANFVAQGGQASVYAEGATAFKVFTDPNAVPPVAKLHGLKGIAHPSLVTPDDDLHAEDGTRVGYTMRFMDGWGPLCRLFPPAYRARNGIDHPGELVLELREVLSRVHAGGALVVDLNELNVLVDPTHSQLAVIDVDSWQLPGFPATALAESVRDRHASHFSTETDWFAFAVLTFQLFTGIHPFRGRHPTARTLDERMLADLSVFHPEVVVPPMVDLAGLPRGWRDWYEALFVHGERMAPPTALDRHAIRAPKPLRNRHLESRVAFDAPETIRGLASWNGRTWVWTDSALFESRRRIGPAPPRGAVALRTPTGIAFAHLVEGRVHHVQNTGESIATGLHADELTAHGGLLHARIGTRLVELQAHETLGRVHLRPRHAATLTAHATELFRGVAVTRAMDSTWIAMLGVGTCHQFAVPELAGLRVVDAVCEAGVAVVVTRGSSGWTRHIVTERGVRSGPAAIPSAELVVLPNGVAVVPTEHGLELFSARDPLGAARTVDGTVPTPLVKVGTRLGTVDDRTVHTLSLRSG